MKTTTAICTLIVHVFVLATNGTSAGFTDAGATLVVCSDSLTPAVQAELKTQIGTLLTTAPAGHRLIVVKGGDHTPVINVAIPVGSARERLRDRTLTQAMGLLRLFLQQTSQGGGAQSLQIGIPNLPATYWSTIAGKGPCKIILVGDPIFDDPRYTFWSFRDGRFPSDAALSEPLSSCPFINRNHPKIPGDVQISILSPAEWGSSQRHRDVVIRWLRLACQESLGGKLVRVTNSSVHAFSQGTRDEFEPVQFDGRQLVGMWILAEGAIISPFPEPGVRPQNAELDNTASKKPNASTPDQPKDTNGSNAAARDDQSVQEGSNLDSEQKNRRLPDARSATVSLRNSGDVSVTAEQHQDEAQADEQSGSPQSTRSMISTPAAGSPGQSQTAQRPPGLINSGGSLSESPIGQAATQPTADPATQNAGPTTDAQSEIELAQPGNQVEDDTDELNPGEPGEDAAVPASTDAANVGTRMADSSTARPDAKVVREKVNATCRDRKFPEELGQLLMRETQRDLPGHAVIATWTSNCPHADLNLHIAGVAVRRDSASSPDGTGRDRIEWGICNSLECDSWINIYDTHRDVRVTVAIIDLKTGTLREEAIDLGSVSDHGRNESNRGTSNAWRKVALNASR